MTKIIQMVGALEYPDELKEVMSVEEYIQEATKKGYRTEVMRRSGKKATTLRIYKETDYRETSIEVEELR